MRAYSEELFGPAAVVYKVANEDEAVELANDSDLRPRRRRLLQRPRQGPVGGRPARGRAWSSINQPTGSSPELPFGGVKRSGYGRELSELGMFEFANRKLTRVLPAKKAAKPAGG